MRMNLDREEMIALVARIMSAEGTEEEIDANIELFVANCRHPAKTDLIYWPSGFPHNPDTPEPTVEQIVDQAMSGKTA